MSFSKETNKKGVLQIIIFPPANAQLIITIVCCVCVCASVYYITQLALSRSLAAYYYYHLYVFYYWDCECTNLYWFWHAGCLVSSERVQTEYFLNTIQACMHWCCGSHTKCNHDHLLISLDSFRTRSNLELRNSRRFSLCDSNIGV